jgi:hypothetical protein
MPIQRMHASRGLLSTAKSRPRTFLSLRAVKRRLLKPSDQARRLWFVRILRSGEFGVAGQLRQHFLLAAGTGLGGARSNTGR